jgi:hypothetical protein
LAVPALTGTTSVLLVRQLASPARTPGRDLLLIPGQEFEHLEDGTCLAGCADVGPRTIRSRETDPEDGLAVQVHQPVRLARLPAQVTDVLVGNNSHVCSPGMMQRTPKGAAEKDKWLSDRPDLADGEVVC